MTKVNNMPSSDDLVNRADVVREFIQLFGCIQDISNIDEWADVCETTVNEIPSTDVVSRKEYEKVLIECGEVKTKLGELQRRAEAVQGDGRNNMKRYPNCQMRTLLGNCDAIGGFCTSINAPICDAFHKLVDDAQGEWIKTVDGNGWNDWYVLKCPFCGATIEDKQCRSWKYNFCPHCGERVKGDNS